MTSGIPWILGVAVALSVGWILKLVYDHLRVGDKAALERAEAETEAHDRIEAAMEREGMLPDDPFVVASAASVEPRAQSEPCPICDGRLHVDAHEIDDTGAVRLRRLAMRCGDCGRTTMLYARVETPAIN